MFSFSGGRVPAGYDFITLEMQLAELIGREGTLVSLYAEDSF